MQFEEDGERIKDLKLILQRVAFAATLFDDDGISIRFMNSQPPLQLLNNVRNEQQIEQLMASVQFKGLTPMGTQLREKVLNEIVGQARSGQLRKPALVITITDGQPAGEPQNAVFDAIKWVSSEFSRMPQYGTGTVQFQFAQVGNDEKAREFLGKLDSDPMVGSLVDCTSSKRRLIAKCKPSSIASNNAQTTRMSLPRWLVPNRQSTLLLSFGYVLSVRFPVCDFHADPRAARQAPPRCHRPLI